MTQRVALSAVRDTPALNLRALRRDVFRESPLATLIRLIGLQPARAPRCALRAAIMAPPKTFSDTQVYLMCGVTLTLCAVAVAGHEHGGYLHYLWMLIKAICT